MPTLPKKKSPLVNYVAKTPKVMATLTPKKSKASDRWATMSIATDTLPPKESITISEATMEIAAPDTGKKLGSTAGQTSTMLLRVSTAATTMQTKTLQAPSYDAASFTARSTKPPRSMRI